MKNRRGQMHCGKNIRELFKKLQIKKIKVILKILISMFSLLPLLTRWGKSRFTVVHIK